MGINHTKIRLGMASGIVAMLVLVAAPSHTLSSSGPAEPVQIGSSANSTVPPEPEPAGSSAVTKKSLQDLYMGFLTQEGYQPQIDSDGDVAFKREGRNYFINIDAADPKFVRIVLPGFWVIKDESERLRALAAAEHATCTMKAAKVFTIKSRVWAAVDVSMEKPEDLKPLLGRSLILLDGGAGAFVKRMNETAAPSQSRAARVEWRLASR